MSSSAIYLIFYFQHSKVSSHFVGGYIIMEDELVFYKKYYTQIVTTVHYYYYALPKLINRFQTIQKAS